MQENENANNRLDSGANRTGERIAQIRQHLDAPTVSAHLDRLTLRQGVGIAPFKDKIAETLEVLLGQPADFNRERLRRKESARLARQLGKVRYLDHSVRCQSLLAHVEDLQRDLERRAEGVERPGWSGPLLHEDGAVRVGPVEIREYGRNEQSDRQHVYDLTVLDLYAILRHLTEEDSRGDVVRFETISVILQAVEVIPTNARDAGDAVRKRFSRANSWPTWVRVGSPPPVDHREDFLFALEGRGPAPRFPDQEPRLDPRWFSTS